MFQSIKVFPGLCYFESLTGSKIDVKYVKTVKSTINRMSKVIECLEQNIRNQIDCKRPSNTKQMNRLQNIRIEIWKYKAVKKYKT